MNGSISIGEAAARTGVAAKTIRYYESIGLMPAAGRLKNRYRAYEESDLQTLRFIRRARDLGFSVRECSELLRLYRDRHRASKDVKRLALAHVAELDLKIAGFTQLRNTIAELAARCHGDQRPDCPILEEFSERRPKLARAPRRRRPR